MGEAVVTSQQQTKESEWSTKWAAPLHHKDCRRVHHGTCAQEARIAALEGQLAANDYTATPAWIALERERDALRAMLAKYQFGSCDGCGTLFICHECEGENHQRYRDCTSVEDCESGHHGHKPDCPLAALLGGGE